MGLLERLNTETLQIIIGILAGIVVIYRIVFMMVPMLTEGFKQNNYATMMKSISLIV
jgi:hypothetical protein